MIFMEETTIRVKQNPDDFRMYLTELIHEEAKKRNIKL